MCTNRYGVTRQSRVALVRTTAGHVYCECVLNNTPLSYEEGDVVQSNCSYAAENDRQAYCLTSYQESIDGSNPTPIKSTCDTCSRTAGTPGARSVP